MQTENGRIATCLVNDQSVSAILKVTDERPLFKVEVGFVLCLSKRLEKVNVTVRVEGVI